ncbi:MAG: 3-phosphoglycerate dehydrogenase [Magnetovibrio sp.]|nr:3-phosphoglycerate dehydrogenase [Magnetovibrio sp.]
MVKRLFFFEKWMDEAGPNRAKSNPNIDLVRMDQSDSEDQIWQALAEAHGYQLRPSTETKRRFWPDRSFLGRCPNLLAVSSAGAGYDMVDVEACNEAGVLVVNQSGSNAESVAQHVIGMILALAKQIIQSNQAIRGEARDWTRWNYCGHELTNRTIGIVGFGNIGRRLARLTKVFSMTVMAYDPYITDADFKMYGVKQILNLRDLFSESDIISVNCPLTAETHGMIGEELYSCMKPSSLFITTARGFIHDEHALVKAISEGRIAGAGCDVFTEEPPPYDHPLLKFENVIVSPHIAGVTSDANYNMATFAADQWGDIFAGKKPERLKNPEVWDHYCARYNKIFGEKPCVG